MSRVLSAGVTPPPSVLSPPPPFVLRYRRIFCQMQRQWVFRAPGMPLNALPIPPNQRFFFYTRPALDLLLESNCTFARFEFSLPNQLHRFEGRGVPDLAREMLLHARVDVVRMAAIVRAVRTSQQINKKRFQWKIEVKASTDSARTGGAVERGSHDDPSALRICSSTSLTPAKSGRTKTAVGQLQLVHSARPCMTSPATRSAQRG